MAIKIGHASSDEERKASGGKAGDQTGGEVTTRSWYSSPWNMVLRFKDAAKAEKAAKAMEAACANANIGYDQGQRNTLNDKAKAVGYDLAKIKEPCETDCSALVSVCAQAAGVDIPYIYGNAPYTGIMEAQFTKTGEFEVLTESKYLTSDAYLKRGDILLRTSGHTAMALENGAKSGAPGATRPTDTAVNTPEPAEVVRVSVSVRQLKKGCVGENVKALQLLLNGNGCNCGDVDGEFGPKTRRAVLDFQKKQGLEQDAIVGKNTWRALLK